MFPASLLDVQHSLLPDVDLQFKNVYDITNNPYIEAVNRVIHVVQMDKRQKRYAYSLTVPLLTIWKRGEKIPESGNSQESFLINVFRWGMKLTWDRDDVDDEVIDTIMEDTTRLAESAKSLRVRVFHQMLEGLADSDLIELTELDPCPDGSDLFDTTEGDGVTPRYYVTGGNLVTGGGVTESAITADIFKVRSRFRRMKHTDEKTPYHDPAAIDKMIFFVPADLELVFQRVLTRKFQSDGTVTGGQSNLLDDMKVQTQLVVDPYLVDQGDWYCIIESRAYGIVCGEREGIRTRLFRSDDDPDHFDNNIESYRVKLREGYAYGPAQSYIKVAQP